ncbi:uncharacterized protein [Dermacentor albipictus]|uniref:uncharacterized protein n=1 Tax=Dermacentor albipictus TaxID=60249 RepID=UPI0031FD73A6
MTTVVRSGDDDDDDESGAPPTARSATVPHRRPPSADRMEFATPCTTPARQRTLAGRCSANGLRSPGNRRRKNTLAEESSESEAEAISERHSKWVTFANPCVLSRAPVTISPEDEQGGRDCGFEKSGLLEDTTTPCLGLAESGAREGSDSHQLSEGRSERLLDISGLIEATSAQFECVGNSESCWTPLNLGKGQPRQVPLEEKVTAWDRCQEDRYALSPPGELELFELDALYPSHPRQPSEATRRMQTRSSLRSSSRMSTLRVQRFKKPLPTRPLAANLYEDLRWIVESSEKSAGPPLRAERVTSTDVETMSAQPQVSIGPPPAASAEWRSKEVFAATGKASSVVLRAPSPSSSRPRNEMHQDYGQLRSGAGWSMALHLLGKNIPEDVRGVPDHECSSSAAPPPDGSGKRTPAVASSVKVAPDPVRLGTQKDEAEEGVVRSSEPAEQEPAAREENHPHHRRDMRRKKRHVTQEAFEAQEERAGAFCALRAQRGGCVFTGAAKGPLRRGHFSLSVGLCFQLPRH